MKLISAVDEDVRLARRFVAARGVMSPLMRRRRFENVMPSSSTLTSLAPTTTDVLADAPGAVTVKALAVRVDGSSTL